MASQRAASSVRRCASSEIVIQERAAFEKQRFYTCEIFAGGGIAKSRVSRDLSRARDWLLRLVGDAAIVRCLVGMCRLRNPVTRD